MNAKKIKLIGCLSVMLFAFATGVQASDFAAEVVYGPNMTRGPFGPSPYYDDPCSVIGKPTTEILDPLYFDPFRCSLVYPACYTDVNGNKLVTTLGNSAAIVVKFDHRVADDPANPYGIDFIVFGNSFFLRVGGDLDPYKNMEDCFLTNPTSVNSEPVIVSVSPDGNNWYTYSNGPYADAAFPTNAYAWDRENHCWGKEFDWTKPIDPNLTVSNFDGLSAADAIDLYGGSAGGTGFDLAESGFKWIQYIKVESNDYGEVDGFADVAGCGDYKHLHPVGDINKDCRVDYKDLELLCRYWLHEINDPNAPAMIADIYEDDVVDLHDFALMANSWAKCNWECE
jgi:hypothetical protein